MEYLSNPEIMKRLEEAGFVCVEKPSEYSGDMMVYVRDEDQPEGVFVSNWGYDCEPSDELSAVFDGTEHYLEAVRPCYFVVAH